MKQFFLFIFVLFTIQTFFGQWSDVLHYTGKLDGTQAGVSTSAVGLVSLTYNTSVDIASIDVFVNGLSGAIVAIHIHEGAPGTSGGVVVDLAPLMAGNRITGWVTSGLDWSKLMMGLLICPPTYL
jgi:hypothetical protein